MGKKHSKLGKGPAGSSADLFSSHFPEENDYLSMEDFERLKVLGHGSFGEVFLVRKRDSRRLYAMKVIEKRLIIDTGAVAQAKAEEALQSVIGRHPLVVNLRYAFQTEESLVIVLDYCGGGDLFDALKAAGRFDETRALLYAAEIFVVLDLMHKRHIVYRDLKMENVLVDSHGHIRLTDFGLAKELSELTLYRTQTVCGTAEYMAPEVGQDTVYSHSADWWAYGIFIFVLVCGKYPFQGASREQLIQTVRAEEVVVPADMGLSIEVTSLIRGLLVPDIAKRLTPEQIREHPWFRGIDWDRVGRKGYDPPVKPGLSAEIRALSEFDDDPEDIEPNLDVIPLPPPPSRTKSSARSTATSSSSRRRRHDDGGGGGKSRAVKELAAKSRSATSARNMTAPGLSVAVSKGKHKHRSRRAEPAVSPRSPPQRKAGSRRESDTSGSYSSPESGKEARSKRTTLPRSSTHEHLHAAGKRLASDRPSERTIALARQASKAAIAADSYSYSDYSYYSYGPAAAPTPRASSGMLKVGSSKAATPLPGSRDRSRPGSPPGSLNGSAPAAASIAEPPSPRGPSPKTPGTPKPSLNASSPHLFDDAPRRDSQRAEPARHEPARHDSTRHDSTRHDSTRHDSTRHEAATAAGRHDSPRVMSGAVSPHPSPSPSPGSRFGSEEPGVVQAQPVTPTMKALKVAQSRARRPSATKKAKAGAGQKSEDPSGDGMHSSNPLSGDAFFSYSYDD